MKYTQALDLATYGNKSTMIVILTIVMIAIH